VIKEMSSYNVSAEEMPEWLNVSFFRNILSITGELSLKNVQFACAKGENFASVIFRVELEIEGERQWMIVKSRPVGGFSEEFSKKFQIFPKEIEMYEIIERLEKIYALAKRDDVTFAPK
jgi:Ecdysteroid kinase-like family